jgi:hypothetical protein
MSIGVHNGICLDGPYKGKSLGWPYDECKVVERYSKIDNRDGKIIYYEWSKKDLGWKWKKTEEKCENFSDSS